MVVRGPERRRGEQVQRSKSASPWHTSAMQGMDTGILKLHIQAPPFHSAGGLVKAMVRMDESKVT